MAPNPNEEPRDLAHDSRDFASHVQEHGILGSEEGDWAGASVEARSDPMIDPGVGDAKLLRTFQFELNPSLPKGAQVTRQALFDAHKRQIMDFLWKDGLVPMEGQNPRVLLSKKSRKYAIAVLCEPRLGAGNVTAGFDQRPVTLQDVLGKR